ncbi:MAG: penicillin acylase family protein [Anaerolineales bacterium]
MLRRILFGFLVVILLLVVLVVGFGLITVRRSFPKVSGEIGLPALDAPVDVYRDRYGVPHIYADTPHDLFFAQGYVHAQDRFWQMDFWRHIGSGRLSEMFGEDSLGNDRFLRTLGWAGIAQQEFDAMSASEQAILQAYADGVNAYLAEHQGSALSLEYAILGLLNPQYQPEAWQPVHSLTWAKVMAWDLGESQMGAEIDVARMLSFLTPQQVAELTPPYPADHPVIVPGFQIGGKAPAEAGYPDLLAELKPALDSLAQRLERVGAVLGSGSGLMQEGIGSNNWVISGERTASGKPFLANDMHLGVQMPSIWYEVGLHCNQKSTDCPYEVTGFSFAGVPGAIVGHTDRIAWGFTNLGPDVVDLYIEKINPDNPDQYEVNGQWVDMDISSQEIKVSGGDPVELTIRRTRHGPLITDVYGPLEDFEQEAGIQLPEQYAIAMRWTALEPNRMIEAVLGYNKAQDWEEFRQAARNFTVPSQNTVYADVEGNIGYQTPGWIPIRNPGHDGRLPVPGWTDEFEWQGYIPFEELPNTFNPSQGYVATANNAVVGPDYPYSISYYWAYGYRAKRIVEMIENASEPITTEYIQQMHGDDANLSAETLLPVLLQVTLEDAELENARTLLRSWDYQDHMDSAASALYNVFWKHLLSYTFHDELPEDLWPGGGGRWFEVMRNLVPQPDSAWWDDQNTSEVENRDQIFARAFASAVAELESEQGKNSQRWTWGDLHTVTFENQSLGQSGIAPIDALFNRGPFRTSGGSEIVNATSWNAAESYQVESIPSERMIVDLSDLSKSLAIHPTGQSGHAYNPHYIDMADLWRKIQYHPMLWERDQVEAGAENHLMLVP